MLPQFYCLDKLFIFTV